MGASAIAFSSAGSDFSVCLTQAASFTAGAYAALAWVEVGEVTSIPTHGDVYAKIEHKPLKQRRVRKLKGTVDGGSFTLAMAFAPGDVGQLALHTALTIDESIPCRETLQDGTVIYFQGLIMSEPHTIGSVDDITAAEVMIEVDSAEIRVYPV